MIPAIPLAYASEHIYSDRNPYAPAARTRSRHLERPRRRRVLGRLRRSPFPRPAFLARRTVPGG